MNASIGKTTLALASALMVSLPERCINPPYQAAISSASR